MRPACGVGVAARAWLGAINVVLAVFTPVYPRVLDELVPSALLVAERYATTRSRRTTAS